MSRWPISLISVQSLGASDVNGDGLGDLICHFESRIAGFEAGDRHGFLSVHDSDGMTLRGHDAVQIVGGRPKQTPKKLTSKKSTPEITHESWTLAIAERVPKHRSSAAEIRFVDAAQASDGFPSDLDGDPDGDWEALLQILANDLQGTIEGAGGI